MRIGNFRPAVPDPYPQNDFAQVSDFKFLSPLVLRRDAIRVNRIDRDGRRRREAHYILHEDYHVAFAVDGQERQLTVPHGMLTDLASVPAIARGLVNRVGPHLEAAIVHDYLFVAWQLFDGREPRREDWRYANEVMFAALAVSAGRFTRTAIKAALRFPFISFSVFRERDDGPDGRGLFYRED